MDDVERTERKEREEITRDKEKRIQRDRTRVVWYGIVWYNQTPLQRSLIHSQNHISSHRIVSYIPGRPATVHKCSLGLSHGWLAGTDGRGV